VVQEPLLEDLLVQARAVKADGLAHLDVRDQGLVRGRGHHAVGVVALVQHEPLEDGLAVDLDLHAVNGDRAQARVAVRGVNDRAVRVAQRNLQVVQVRVRNRPEPAAVFGNGQCQARGQVQMRRHGSRRHLALGVLQGRVQGQAGLVLRQRLFQVERAVRDIRGEARALQRDFGDRLDPHGLPDARRSGVVAAVRGVLLGLLAARLRRVPVVACPNHDRERIAAGDFRQCHGKRRPPAPVAHHFLAVHPDRRIIIHRSEVQQDVSPLPLLRRLDRPAIPDGRHEIHMADARKRRLGAERDRDLVI